MLQIPENSPTGINIDDLLNKVDYESYNDLAVYKPTKFAISYINFIKLANDGRGEENISPVMHYKWVDKLVSKKKRIANLCSRGMAKTTVYAEYLSFYAAIFQFIPELGKISGLMFVADSIENGAKGFRQNLEFRYNNSEFLQKYLPYANFTDKYIEFKNVDGKPFMIKLYGAKTGIRGTKIYGSRPKLAILDDLLSDEDATSPTAIQKVKEVIQSGIFPAMNTANFKVVYNGTPFNKNDPLYSFIESGAWEANVFPVCDKFPCTKAEFRGAWEEKFTYEYVKDMYDAAKQQGMLKSFNQEYMLRISSEEDRLLQDSDILWYDRSSLLRNKHAYHFYITTDFATSSKNTGDYSTIAVWAYNSAGYWFWVDGICKKQEMDKNLDDLFAFVQQYAPKEVGIEISGQQGGFIPWINDQMMERSMWFKISGNGKGTRPTKDKWDRFNVMVPKFKLHQMFFPRELRDTHPWLIEMENEVMYVTGDGIKSRNDDVLDNISMLTELKPWKPSAAMPIGSMSKDGMWRDPLAPASTNNSNSYIV